ncbi:MAG: hypothetical protein EBS06_00090 [Proteobacteria bacterium]|nr:hypothetical protein [Pseudomonadota bacterium]
MVLSLFFSILEKFFLKKTYKTIPNLNSLDLVQIFFYAPRDAPCLAGIPNIPNQIIPINFRFGVTKIRLHFLKEILIINS